jgi:hypothetical protein
LSHGSIEDCRIGRMGGKVLKKALPEDSWEGSFTRADRFAELAEGALKKSRRKQ